MTLRQGVLQQPISLLLNSTSVIDVLSLASGRTDVITVDKLKIVNQDTTDRKVSVWWNDGTTDYRIFEAIVGANSTIWDDAVDVKLYAKAAARKIKAQAAASNVITITLTTSSAPQQTGDASHSGSGA